MFLIAVLLFMYLPVLIETPVLRYDDHYLIDPIKDIHSMADYQEMRQKFKVLDIQPIRDVSYWIDWQISRIGYPVFHATNLLIWFCVLLVFFYVSRRIFQKKWTPQIMTMYLAIHPATINSVAWIAARKHLLSALFILVLSAFFLKKIKEQNNLLSIKNSSFFILLFLASLLSHPINCLWPIWAFAVYFHHSKTKNKYDFFFWAILALVTAWIVQINYSYYFSNEFASQFVSKHWVDGDTLSVKITAIGRYVFQLLIPIQPSISSYYPGEPTAIVGLFLAPIFLYFSFKLFKMETLLLLVLFVVLPISVVTVKMTSVFAIDTYLLTPILGWGIWLGLFFEKVIEKYNFLQSTRIISFFVCWIFVILGLISMDQAHQWKSETTLYRRAYELEKSPFTLNLYGLQLLNEEKYFDALEVGLELYRWNFGQHLSMPIIGESLLKLTTLSWQKKYQILLDHKMSGDLFLYYNAVFLAQQDRWDEAVFNYWQIISNFSPMTFEQNGISISQVFDDIKAVCRHSKLELCQQVPQRLIEIQTQIHDKNIKK